jgi:hypothetical protein
LIGTADGAKIVSMRRLLCTLVLSTALSTMLGCASYRYEISPAEDKSDSETMLVVKNQDLVVPAPPARLRLRQVESRCVLMIENPGDSEIMLDGPGSAIVDPLGQSRAIAGQLIPPGAFVKLVLPPLRDAPPAGPAFQFGVGMQVLNDEPRPVQYLDVGRSQEYWEWDADRPIRLVLSFKQKDQTFRHAYVLTRTQS